MKATQPDPWAPARGSSFQFIGLLPTLVLLTSLSTACTGSIRPSLVPSHPRAEALLVLPGVGYGRAGERAFKALAPSMAAEGFDLFVPTYLSRSGLVSSRAKLSRFLHERGLARYERVHVFAFLAGAWTFNPLMDLDPLPNLATVVYDRSPYQERAPRIADEKLHLLTRLRYGSPVFELARTPYPPLGLPGVKVGLVVETSPTSFIVRHADTARGYGPFDFGCDRFLQPYDDCRYLALDHDALYRRFGDVWPDLLTFIRSGRFAEASDRRLPTDHLLEGRSRERRR